MVASSANRLFIQGFQKESEAVRIQREIKVQQERIAQASRALSYCRTQSEFRGSREEVDAQKALLLATVTNKQLHHEANRLARGRPSKKMHGPLGGLTISSIACSLNRDFVNGQISNRM